MICALQEVARMIDHALLHPTLTDSELDKGCALALQHQVASVCVKPYHVSRAAKLLRRSTVAVGTVIGFPHGGHTTAVKRFEAREAIADGAAEIDMVCNIGQALSGNWTEVKDDIAQVCDEAHAAGAIVKVIFETDFLSNDETKIRLCEVSEAAGADFVKTSTGFGYARQADGSFATRGATEHDIGLMRQSCSARVQVKASGGMRDLKTLLRMRELGASRCGTSATEAILREYAALSQGRPIIPAGPSTAY